LARSSVAAKSVWFGVASLVAVLVLLAAACGGGEQPDGETSGERGRSPIAVGPGTVDSLRADGTASEVLELMEDGDLTFEEYEQTVFSYMRCMEDFGFEAVSNFPRLTPWGTYQVRIASFSFGERGIAPGEVSAHSQECERSYRRGISRLWELRHQPTELELQDARKAFARCLRERGIDVEGDPGQSAISAQFMEANGTPEFEEWVECHRRVDDEHFITGTNIELAPTE
jgi:hypothetical protein